MTTPLSALTPGEWTSFLRELAEKQRNWSPAHADTPTSGGGTDGPGWIMLLASHDNDTASEEEKGDGGTYQVSWTYVHPGAMIYHTYQNRFGDVRPAKLVLVQRVPSCRLACRAICAAFHIKSFDGWFTAARDLDVPTSVRRVLTEAKLVEKDQEEEDINALATTVLNQYRKSTSSGVETRFSTDIQEDNSATKR